LFLLVLLALLSATAGTLLAAPLPPLLVANHQTKECGEIFAGDECMDCYPPEGWEVLGDAHQAECPPGYTIVNQVGYSCQPFKVEHCCTEGHSGAPGDCEDLVVNDRTEQCAFVADIQDCLLPRSWREKPETLPSFQWVCPHGYDWIDTLDCTVGGESFLPESLRCTNAILLAPFLAGLWLIVKRK
jgi:hypothetical protein